MWKCIPATGIEPTSFYLENGRANLYATDNVIFISPAELLDR